MIKVFKANETNFNHNENVIKPLSCIVEEKTNGMYELILESTLEYKDILKEWNIIQAPTENGLQLFRIYKPVKDLYGITVYANHIFYDLDNNFIENIRLMGMNTTQALNHILNNTKDSHNFTATSNLNVIADANYVRKSPVEAILGGDNAIVNRWGGLLVRDNFNINVIEHGRDNGYKIQYGKNLKGILIELDLDNIVTRVMPTWVDDSNTVQYLPEKYIESPLLYNYPFPITKELRLNLNEDLKELELNELHDYYRDYVNLQFEKGLDKPKINVKVDFLELSKTEEYKDFKFLETVKQNDLINVIVDKLDINIKANVVYTKYDCLEKKYLNLEIGNFKTDLSLAQKEFMQLQQEIKSEDFLHGAIENATNLITGNNGGYVILRNDANKKPYEILIMDTDNIQTAQKVWRWNKNGLGYSETGYEGSFGMAITNDGKIVADFILAGVLSGNLIRAGAIEGGKVSWNLDTGALNIDNDIVYDPTTRTTTINGTTKLANGIINKAHISNGVIDSAKIDNLDARFFTLDGVTLDSFVDNKIKTSGFEFNNNGSFDLNGPSIGMSSNSQYLTIKDTGGRGQVDVNGTISAFGGGYFYEMNAGGIKLNRSESAGVRNNGGAGELYYSGGASVRVSGSDIYLNNKRITFESGGAVKWV